MLAIQGIMHICNPGANPLKKLVKHFRWHSHEVKFIQILSAEFDHQNIIETTLPVSLDSEFNTTRSVELSSPSSVYIHALQFQFGCRRAVALPEYNVTVVSPHSPFKSEFFELHTRIIEMVLK